jgi:hypothetical protein
MRSKDQINAHLEALLEDPRKKFDHIKGEIFYKRYVGQYLNLMAGGVHIEELEKDKTRGALGVGYTLPMLIEIEGAIDHKGKLSLMADKKFQWTKHLFTEIEGYFHQELYPEYKISLMYSSSWSWAGGLFYTNDDLGVGLRYQF